jgi:hypothetical protein
MKLIYLFIPFLFLGCCAQRPLAETQPADPPATVPGTVLSLPDADDVRNREALKEYPTGRYEDPNDPSVMHEAHVLYRAEQPPSWNLNPTGDTGVPLGPTVAVTNPAKETAAMAGELEQKVQQQNQLLQTTFEQNQQLSEELKKLQDEVAKTHQIVVVNEALQKQVADLQVQLTKLQQQLAALSHPTPPAVPKPAEQKSWWQFWLSTSAPVLAPTNPTPTKGNK